MNELLDKVKSLDDGKLHCRIDSHGVIREVRCKSCGVKIAGMVISDDEPEQVVMEGRLITVSPMQFVHLSNYAEGTIEFDDGSAHVTHGCRNCINKIKRSKEPEEELFDWYVKDVAIWVKEMNIIGSGELSDRDLTRTPVRMV